MNDALHNTISKDAKPIICRTGTYKAGLFSKSYPIMLIGTSDPVFDKVIREYIRYSKRYIPFVYDCDNGKIIRLSNPSMVSIAYQVKPSLTLVIHRDIVDKAFNATQDFIPISGKLKDMSTDILDKKFDLNDEWIVLAQMCKSLVHTRMEMPE